MTDFLIGCTGFFSLKGTQFAYPAGLPKDKYLEYYSSFFNLVEIHSSFYKDPNKKTLQLWNKTTPDDFKFLFKISKQITHAQKLVNSNDQINEFCKPIADELKDKLAGFVYQLPPSFYNTKENQQLIFKNINNEFQNIIEFRNPTWWGDDSLINKLKRKKITMASLSIPNNIPDYVINSNQKNIYYKLYGTPDQFNSSYMNDFLDLLYNDLKVFKKNKYVIFANTNGKGAVDNALYLKNISK